MDLAYCMACINGGDVKNGEWKNFFNWTPLNVDTLGRIVSCQKLEEMMLTTSAAHYRAHAIMIPRENREEKWLWVGYFI